MKTCKPIIYGFLGLLVLSALFCTFSLSYSMLNRLSAQNMQSQWDQLEQENLRAAQKEAQYKNWLNIDKEFNGFKEKYLMKMDDYSKFRNQLTSLFAKNQLQTTGVKHSYKAVFRASNDFRKIIFALRYPKRLPPVEEALEKGYGIGEIDRQLVDGFLEKFILGAVDVYQSDRVLR